MMSKLYRKISKKSSKSPKKTKTNSSLASSKANYTANNASTNKNKFEQSITNGFPPPLNVCTNNLNLHNNNSNNLNAAAKQSLREKIFYKMSIPTPSLSKSSSSVSSSSASASSSIRLHGPATEFMLNRNFENLKIEKHDREEQTSENAVAESLYNNNKTEQIIIDDPMMSSHEANAPNNKAPPESATAKMTTTTTTTLASEIKGRFVDEPEYDMSHPRRGTAVIINNKRFDSRLEMPTRDGTDKDACALELSLYKLGFDVRTAHNCTALFMRDFLKQQAKADHSQADCFLCVIMTHGENGVVYGVDREIELDQLIHPFKFNRTLAGKPKLFFVQACRGTNLMEGIDSNPTEANCVNKIPMEADFLIAYSTISGFYSWRNSSNGSWFIQSLCQILNEYGATLELMKLLTYVNRRVAYYYESNTNDQVMNGKRQVPSIVSMLTKEVYFKSKSSFSKSYQISYA